MKRYPFNTAYTQAREMYGLELNPDEFENIGITAWGMIGNKDIRLYKYQTTPLQDDAGAYFVADGIDKNCQKHHWKCKRCDKIKQIG